MKKLFLLAFLILNSSFVIAQEGISGGAIIQINVNVDSLASVNKFNADTLEANDLVTTPLLNTTNIAVTSTSTFGDDATVDSTLTADSVKATTLSVIGNSAFGDDATFDSTVTATEITADTIHSGSLDGIAKFTSGVLGVTDTLAPNRITGLADSLSNHMDSIAAHRTALNAFIQGTATIGAGDSVRVAISGLTTSGILVTAYKKTTFLVADTAATWYVPNTDTLTIFGKYNETVSYFGKK